MSTKVNGETKRIPELVDDVTCPHCKAPMKTYIVNWEHTAMWCTHCRREIDPFRAACAAQAIIQEVTEQLEESTRDLKKKLERAVAEKRRWDNTVVKPF